MLPRRVFKTAPSEGTAKALPNIDNWYIPTSTPSSILLTKTGLVKL
jgi:hypothetical protein